MTTHVGRGSRGSIVYPEGTYNSRPLSGSWGADPRGSAASVISNRSVGRPRRSSISAARPSTRAHSPPPVSRHLDAYNARLEAHSSSPTSRPRRGSISYAPSGSHSVRHGDPRASAPIIRSSDPRASASSIRRSSDEEQRKGSTRFPRKFVNRQAVEEFGLPFDEDKETGAITVFKAMSKSQIDDLIERTALIRMSKERRGGGPPRRSESRTRHSHHGDPRASSDKHVAFAPTKTVIIHDDDSRPASSGRGPSLSEQRAIEKNLGELERKAAAANEARIRAEEVAKMVHEDERVGSRPRRDVVVVR